MELARFAGEAECAGKSEVRLRRKSTAPPWCFLEVLILNDFKSLFPEVLILRDFKSFAPEVLILVGLKLFVFSEIRELREILEVLILGELEELRITGVL